MYRPWKYITIAQIENRGIPKYGVGYTQYYYQSDNWMVEWVKLDNTNIITEIRMTCYPSPNEEYWEYFAFEATGKEYCYDTNHEWLDDYYHVCHPLSMGELISPQRFVELKSDPDNLTYLRDWKGNEWKAGWGIKCPFASYWEAIKFIEDMYSVLVGRKFTE